MLVSLVFLASDMCRCGSNYECLFSPAVPPSVYLCLILIFAFFDDGSLVLNVSDISSSEKVGPTSVPFSLVERNIEDLRFRLRVVSPLLLLLM